MKLKEALKLQREFSARGSRCPICKRDFRHGCNHSVVEARQKLERNVIEAIVEEKMKQGVKS